MRLVRIHAGESGELCFEDLEIELQADALGRISRMMPAGQVFVRELKRALVVDYHRAPRRQLVFFVSGTVEIESSNGVRTVLRAGGAILAENTTGKGHITRVIDGPATCVYVPVPAEFDIAAFCRAVRANEMERTSGK